VGEVGLTNTQLEQVQAEMREHQHLNTLEQLNQIIMMIMLLMVEMGMLEEMRVVLERVKDPWRILSPVCLVQTTQSMQTSLKLVLHVKTRLLEATMQILRVNVRCSISVLEVLLENYSNSTSSALMEQSSIRSFSSVIGGSTLTALRQKSSIPRMMTMLPLLLLLMKLLLKLRLLIKELQEEM